ncbi:molybdenum cofactor biosynthesis protein MoaE [Microcella sp.]|uniref:molybdenum cofactor biosynthesis protein MoaE n=1 Tax=Microcella sp. TaxID=1913979 RepID=UPI00391A8304
MTREATAPTALVTAAPLDAAAIEAAVATRADGALVTFRGIVRDHDHGQAVTGLDYLAHPDAEDFLRASCERVAAETGLRVAAAHRTGPLEIGDLALVAAVAAPHRAAAFAAIDRLVDDIKSTVPIWKRQHVAGGTTEWVGL